MRNLLDILQAHEIDPQTWSGSYHAYIIGKTGEVLYSLGVIPALRTLIPRAKLVWHVAIHYQPVLEYAEPEFQPDEVADHVLPAHSDQNEAVRLAVVEGPHALIGIQFDAKANSVYTNFYRTHPWYAIDPDNSPRKLPFYSAFADAAGLPDSALWRPPGTYRDRDGGLYAVALPTANVHSRLRRLETSPPVWGELAKRAQASGLEPVANGHAGDGPLPEMPGWRQTQVSGIEELLNLLRHSAWVIGLNSGAVFAHMLLGPEDSCTSMLDPQGRGMYRFESMRAVVRPAQHHQITFHPRMLAADGVGKWLQAEGLRVLK